jgi:hypothetical protein
MPAGLHGGEQQLEEGRAVRQQQGHAISRTEASGAQRMDEPVARREQLARGKSPTVRVYRCNAIGLSLGADPKAADAQKIVPPWAKPAAVLPFPTNGDSPPVPFATVEHAVR